MKPNRTPNTISCLDIRHTAHLTICSLDNGRRINVERQHGSIQQGIKDSTNILYGLMIHMKKPMLMEMKCTDKILIEHMEFDLEGHVR